MQVVIPMAGIGSRFKKYGFKENKYLLPINIELEFMIEQAIVSLKIPNPSNYFFIIKEENGIDMNLRNILDTICKKHGFEYSISSVDKLTEGPASTVFMLQSIINMDYPMIVSNSDQVLDWNYDRFLEKCQDYDGCVLTYKPDYKLILNNEDKHSFVQFNEFGKVIRCAEKIVLSDNALVGVHYFKRAELFFDAYSYMVKNNIRAPNGEFYLSLAYQTMIEHGHSVGNVDIDINSEHFYPVGEPDDYFKYLYEHGGYTHNILNIKQLHLHEKITKLKIKYVESNSYIENPGFIILLSGKGILRNEHKINPYQITTKGIIPQTMCECILIEYNHKIQSKQIWDIHNFPRGWFINNCSNNNNNTRFEFSISKYNKNEIYDFHYYKSTEEINVLLSGSMLINNKKMCKNDVLIIHNCQVVCPIFLEDSIMLSIKKPFVSNDTPNQI